jgi:hypothetical protein
VKAREGAWRGDVQVGEDEESCGHGEGPG